MSSVLRPRGPERAAVYWRRRAVIVGGFLLIVAIVAVLLSGTLGGHSGSGGPSGLPDTGGEPRVCESSDLKVSLVRFKREWPDHQTPGFTGTIMNTSNSACKVDIAADTSLLIVSGSDRIYASVDCGPGEAQSLTIAAGHSEETSVVWDRTRSVPGCAPGQPDPRPGTYRATWSVRGAESGAEVFVLQD